MTRQDASGPFPLSIAGLLLFTLASCGAPQQEGVDLILGDGVIRLGDLRTPVGAVAIDGDRIVASGSVAEIRRLAVESTQEMTLEEAAVLPGLVDAWIDLEAVGRWEEGLDLRAAVSPREAQAILRSDVSEGGWTVGWGWDETLWPEPVLPDRRALDELGETPILLYRRIGRVGWANTAALQAAGLLDGASADGLFRDQDGRATGIVAREALARIEARLPAPPRQLRRGWLEAGARAAAAAGITSVATVPLDLTAVELLRELDASGDLAVRARVRLHPDTLDSAARPSPESTGFVTIHGVGLVLDGPFRPPLAATESPYGGQDPPPAYLDRASVRAACEAAEARQLALDVRAHGDAAIRLALEACPALAEGRGLVVGAELLPSDAPADARIVALPLRMTHDFYWIEQLLGADRSAAAHAFRDLLGSGRLAAAASAAPEHDLDTPGWLRAFSTRRDADGYPLDGWRPGQRISIGDALRVATAPLVAAAPGGNLPADLVIWSADPLGEDVDPAGLRALVTIVGGRVVYSRPLVDVPFDME